MGCGASIKKPEKIEEPSRVVAKQPKKNTERGLTEEATARASCGPSADGGAPGGRFRGVKVSYLLGRFRDDDFQEILAEKPDAKVYDVEPRIRELTADAPCPKDDEEPCQGSALVDWLDDTHAGRANLMLSYGWGYEVRKIIDALAEYCRRRQLNPAAIIVWICCLCINQHRVKKARQSGRDVPFDTFRREFADRVVGIGNVVALLSPWNAPLYITRVWCAFELFEATANEGSGVRFEVILPSSDAEDLKKNLKAGNMAGLWQTLANLDIKKAKASVESDRENIFKLIAEGPGFAKVNGEVATRIGEWFAATCKALVKEIEETLGELHVETLTAIANLGALLKKQGKLAEAEPYFRRALEGNEATLGAMHMQTLMSVSNLGVLLESQGKLAEAEPYLRRALEGMEATLGAMHMSTLISVSNLGLLLESQGKPAEAEPYYRRALEGNEATLGAMHMQTLISAGNLGVLLENQGKLAEAEPYYRRALEGNEATLGPTHPSTLIAAKNLGVFLQKQGRLAEAELLLRRAKA